MDMYTQALKLRKQPNFSRSVFLTVTIYFGSEQGNRFGVKIIFRLLGLHYVAVRPIIS